jgi:integrase
MPAHVKKRADRKGVYYLVDGKKISSLGTDKKGIAEQLLTRYIQGKLSLNPIPTVQAFYDSWITTKIAPLFRPAQARDYRQHFSAYILAKWVDGEKHVRQFGGMSLSAIGTGDLIDFRDHLLRKGLSIKTTRNIIDSSFRALYRDARLKHDALRGRDPFLDIQWPRSQREKPFPFTADERDRIIEYWKAHDFFYFPWVFVLFHTGMRPSEASALTWNDINLERRTISISKSRYMSHDDAPKTDGSKREITIPEDDYQVIEALKLLPSRALGIKNVFINKDGKPVNAKKWAEHNWAKPLKDLGIAHRKFYSTRHTFITEKIKDGHSTLAVAQYCGTSEVMIQKDYCGTLGLPSLGRHQTKIEPESKKLNENMVAGPGFEPGTSRL